MEAIENTIEKLEGTWGLVIIFKREPEHIYCAQNGSHIVIGFGDDSVLLASEARAFEKYTKNILDMKDGEIFKLGKNAKGDYTILNKNIQKLQTPKVERQVKGGYETYFEKEIFEQADAVYNSLGKSSRIDTNNFSAILGGLQENAQNFKGVNTIYFFGCGSSLLACQYASYFFKMLGIFENVYVLEASDVEEHDLPKSVKYWRLIIRTRSECLFLSQGRPQTCSRFSKCSKRVDTLLSE